MSILQENSSTSKDNSLVIYRKEFQRIIGGLRTLISTNKKAVDTQIASIPAPSTLVTVENLIVSTGTLVTAQFSVVVTTGGSPSIEPTDGDIGTEYTVFNNVGASITVVKPSGHNWRVDISITTSNQTLAAGGTIKMIKIAATQWAFITLE